MKILQSKVDSEFYEYLKSQLIYATEIKTRKSNVH